MNLCAETEIPHPNNACSGRFSNWLEINLTPQCNASCAWCVERNGWHPEYEASWKEIADVAIGTGKRNIILLGGEPTLYPHFAEIAKKIACAGRRVWVTTNGSMLTPQWVISNMEYIYGVNISIHNYYLAKNYEVTGIQLTESVLLQSIVEMEKAGVNSVRFNCNLIKGHIDSFGRMLKYVQWAKGIGADRIRFAELKGCDGEFVDVGEITGYRFGTNSDPYRLGCSCDTIIFGVPVNFRQMCGLQTRRRPCPQAVKYPDKPVLYYNAKLYQGWQQRRRGDMNAKGLIELLESVAKGNISPAEAAILIDRGKRKDQEVTRRSQPEGGGFCTY